MMRRFTRVSSVAIPILEADIDTDAIFPARFLLLLEKAGVGRHLFHDRRYMTGGAADPRFILNQPPFDRANILVAGRNFGCGSSREQAVWALEDFGICCVIAPSFGEIFRLNCFRNGVLAIQLSQADHRDISGFAQAGQRMTVDLQTCSITAGSATLPFEIDAHDRRALLAGLDQIGLILMEDLGDLERLERTQLREMPWVSLPRDRFAAFAGDG